MNRIIARYIHGRFLYYKPRTFLPEVETIWENTRNAYFGHPVYRKIGAAERILVDLRLGGFCGSIRLERCRNVAAFFQKVADAQRKLTS